MTDELTKALLDEDVASARGVAEALHVAVSQGVPLVRALLETGAVGQEALSRVLAIADAPVVSRVVPARELVSLLPPGLCARLHVVPVRRDGMTGTVDVAMADVTDAHAASEIAFHLGTTVRPVRASLAAMTEGLRLLSGAAPPPASTDFPPMTPRSLQRALLVVTEDDDDRPVAASGRRSRDTPPWGTQIPKDVKGSDAPKSGVGSEIPIPLTRRTFSAVSGGTQRPPPLVDPATAALGEGYDLDVDALRPVVEVDERAREDIPLAPRVPPFADAPPSTERNADRLSTVAMALPDALAEVREASTRDEILERLLTSAEHVADKVALFVVRRGGYLGWSCSAAFAPRDVFQEVLLPLDADNVFDRSVHDGPTLGPVPRDEAHAALWAAMKDASPDVAIVPVRVKDKAIVILLADSLVDTMLATRHLEELAAVAGEAFARLLRDR